MNIYITLLYWYVRVEYIIYKTYFYQVIRTNMIQNNWSRRTGEWILDLKMIIFRFEINVFLRTEKPENLPEEPFGGPYPKSMHLAKSIEPT